MPAMVDDPGSVKKACSGVPQKHPAFPLKRGTLISINQELRIPAIPLPFWLHFFGGDKLRFKRIVARYYCEMKAWPNGDTLSGHAENLSGATKSKHVSRVLWQMPAKHRLTLRNLERWETGNPTRATHSSTVEVILLLSKSFFYS